MVIPAARRAPGDISAGQRGVYVVRVSGLEGDASTAPPFTREPSPGAGGGLQGDSSTPLGNPLTRAVATVVSDSLTRERTVKIENLLAGVRSEAWVVLLRDWDRSLRAGSHPETTRYNYVLTASQLTAYLGEQLGDGCRF
jgi:hypothetical protein